MSILLHVLHHARNLNRSLRIDRKLNLFIRYTKYIFKNIWENNMRYIKFIIHTHTRTYAHTHTRAERERESLCVWNLKSIWKKAHTNWYERKSAKWDWFQKGFRCTWQYRTMSLFIKLICILLSLSWKKFE